MLSTAQHAARRCKQYCRSGTASAHVSKLPCQHRGVSKRNTCPCVPQPHYKYVMYACQKAQPQLLTPSRTTTAAKRGHTHLTMHQHGTAKTATKLHDNTTNTAANVQHTPMQVAAVQESVCNKQQHAQETQCQQSAQPCTTHHAHADTTHTETCTRAHMHVDGDTLLKCYSC